LTLTCAEKEGRHDGGGLRVWAVALKLAVSAGLLILLARNADLGVVTALLVGLPLWSALNAVACLAGIAVVSALRWWLVMRAIGAPLPLARITALMFVGNFFTQVLPTSIGGDAVRIWQVRRDGIRFERAFIGVMLERISGLIALVAMVAGGVLWLGDRVQPPALGLLLLAALPVLLAGLTLLCLLDRLPARLGGQLRRLRFAGGFLDLLAAMAGDARRILLSQPLSIYLLLLSALAHLLSALAVLVLARGLGLPLDLAASLAVVPSIILITFIPLSFAGWGLREGASTVMLGFVGLTADQAVAVSILLGLGLLVAGLPGLGFWLHGGRRPTPALR